MRSYVVEGIVLKSRQWGEADQILTVFTKEQGKVVVRAPGARRVTSRKRGSIQTFSRVKLFVVRGKTWDVVTEAEMISGVFGEKDLGKLVLAYQWVELVDKLTAEGQEQKEVYELLRLALSSLEKVTKDKTGEWKRRFTVKLLVLLGFWPDGREVRGKEMDLYVEEILGRRLTSEEMWGEE